MSASQLLLRIDSELHAILRKDARKMKVSLNQLCSERLLFPHVLNSLPNELQEGVLAGQKAAGANLVGMVLFGSWARGQQSDQSDIDLLIVLEADTKINRVRYTKWQEHEENIGRCEPHFVSLPKSLDHISGLWAEIATDGIVLMDAQLKIQRFLSQVRRAVSEGKLLAKKVHGHTYWIRSEVA